MFVTKAVIVAVVANLLAGGQAAVIEARAPEGLEVVKVEQHPSGTLTWYGDASSVPRDVSARDAGCGTNTIKCAGSHAYDGALCQQLIASLNTNIPVSSSPRAVCLGQGSDQCCISWSKVTFWGIVEKDLLPSVQRVYKECGSGFSNSGQEWNVLLDGTCLSQCLSNRPDGCK